MSAVNTRIVILGGGFGGVYTAKYLWQYLNQSERARTSISLVSPENYLVFQPMLPEVISGTLETLHVISPIRRIVPHAALYVRPVEGIDITQQCVRLSPGISSRHFDLHYDHVVIALGTRLAANMVPGLQEHAIAFKYLGDALRLRNQLVQVLEEAAIEENAQERKRLLTFVVAGGGFSGVECIAEMHDFLMHAIKSYPTLRAKDIRTILLQSGDHILPEMKPTLARFAHDLLQRRGVEIRVNTRLVSVSERLATVKHRQADQVEFIATRTVVATVPVEPHPLLATLPVTKVSNRIKVNSYLYCDEVPNIWAVGDCAAIPLGDDRWAPPTAQHALREARQCARNIVAQIRQHPMKKFDHTSLGSLCSLGRRSAVADVFGLKISGLLAWLLWRVVYLAKFPGLDRKARILADWTMDMFLRRDISQVRIFRNAQVRREHIEPGETIFLQGDFGDRIYFVIDGKAEIDLDGRVVDVVGAGGVIGEIALLVDSPRTATVRARTAMNLASVSRDTFHTLVAHFPGVAAAMQEILKSHTEGRPEHPSLSLPQLNSSTSSKAD